jgi:hypothetical protein
VAVRPMAIAIMKRMQLVKLRIEILNSAQDHLLIGAVEKLQSPQLSSIGYGVKMEPSTALLH